jgi:hypothetical protein
MLAEVVGPARCVLVRALSAMSVDCRRDGSSRLLSRRAGIRMRRKVNAMRADSKADKADKWRAAAKTEGWRGDGAAMAQADRRKYAVRSGLRVSSVVIYNTILFMRVPVAAVVAIDDGSRPPLVVAFVAMRPLT